MPNWAKGSLKLRGRSENIASALKEMLLNDTVTLEDEYDGTLLKFNNTAPYFYINNTRRAFIDQKQIEVWFEEKFCIVELDNFKQAWSAIPENYKEISSKFDVDIKIFTLGFEECMRVLKTGGTLIFKWSDCQVNVKEILKVIPFKPLFGQQRGTTHWMTFVKFEEVE